MSGQREPVKSIILCTNKITDPKYSYSVIGCDLLVEDLWVPNSGLNFCLYEIQTFKRAARYPLP